MKKSKILMLIMAAVVVLNACKAREKCPAYGSKTPHKSSQKPS
jgi:PBP1b-binding outer membrane lipoprotein LpoB